MPGDGVIYGAGLGASVYIYSYMSGIPHEWNPGSGSFPDLFENLGKSFLMSVFWNYSLASKVCFLNK